MYAQVIGGAVVKTLGTLPKAYTFSDGSKTGNFDEMDAAIHVAEGYYPLIEDKPVINADIQRHVVGSDTIGAASVTRSYTAENIPLAELITGRLIELDMLLASKLAGSQFTYAGEVFNFHQQAAEDATQLQTLLGIGAQFPANFSWTQADGQEMPMNQVTFVDFAGTLAGHKLGLVGVAKTHAATIKALTDAQAIVDYDVTAGW